MKKLSLPHVLSLAVAAVCVAVPGYAATDFSGSPAEATAFPAGTAAEDDILAAADISAPEPAPPPPNRLTACILSRMMSVVTFAKKTVLLSAPTTTALR